MPLPDKSLPFREWYDLLLKPSWTPSISTIGTIWTILYPLIAVVYGFSLWQVLRGNWPKSILLPIILNIFFNLSFTPIQFGLRNFILASVVVVLVWATALWSAWAIYPQSKLVAGILVPYILWTATASVLQIQITWLNR